MVADAGRFDEVLNILPRTAEIYPCDERLSRSSRSCDRPVPFLRHHCVTRIDSLQSPPPVALH